MSKRMARLLRTRLHQALVGRSFDYFRWRRYRAYVRSVPADREPVIIHQMGKVGSSAVAETLAGCCPRYAVFQVHVLTWPWIKDVEYQYRVASRDRGRQTIDEHVLAARYLRTRIDTERHTRRWKVISIVRDPVARNISAFFQAFPIYFSKLSANLPAGHAGALPTDELVRLFMEEFRDDRHQLPLEWFQLHMAPAFGIDVYGAPFDREAGFSVYRNASCELLVLRMEDLRHSLRPALRAFLGVDLSTVAAANVSADKAYAASYHDFRQLIRLPEGYLDRMYESQYARHFYTDAEIASFRQRWECVPG